MASSKAIVAESNDNYNKDTELDFDPDCILPNHNERQNPFAPPLASARFVLRFELLSIIQELPGRDSISNFPDHVKIKVKIMVGV